MKIGKLTGLLLLTVLFTACTAEQAELPEYAEPEETTAVRISPEESDPPDVSGYQFSASPCWICQKDPLEWYILTKKPVRIHPDCMYPRG